MCREIPNTSFECEKLDSVEYDLRLAVIGEGLSDKQMTSEDNSITITRQLSAWGECP